MKLLTATIEKAFIRQGNTSQKEAKDIKIICKFFGGGAYTAYLYERDAQNPDLFMAHVTLGDPFCAECGTVSLSEIQAIKFPPFSLPVERDLYFDIGEMTLQDVIDANERMKAYK